MIPPARPLTDRERAALAPFFDARTLARVRVRQGLPWGFGRHVDGVALGRTVWLRDDRPGTPHGLRLLAHEVAHVAQWAEAGALRFLARYLADYLRGRWRGLPHDAAYRAIGHEVAARQVEHEVLRRWQDGDA